MGSLANWGALAGAGKGLQALSETKTKDRQTQEKITAEEERAIRLAAWNERKDIRAEGRKTTSDREQAVWLEETIAGPQREDTQAHEIEKVGMQVAGRQEVADTAANATAGRVRNRIFEYLAKGDDVETKNEMNQATYEQEIKKFHKPSSKLYKEWNASTGTLDFPSGRDPLDMAEKLGIAYDEKKDRDNEAAIRTEIIGRISAYEGLLLKAHDTPSEISIRGKFESMFGYLPLEYRRLTHARSLFSK